MYITQLHFDKILEWFHNSRYELLMLFLPTGNPKERILDDYIIKNQSRINKLTGKSITYIAYINCSIEDGDVDTSDNFVSVDKRRLSMREIGTHINISDEVCDSDKFSIEQYKLPALILIGKDDTYNLYPISTEADFDAYFALINTVTSFQKDYNHIYEVERNISRLTKSPYESTEKEKILSIYGDKINESICIPNGKEILQAVLSNYSSGLIELLNMVKNRIPEKINNKNIHKVFIAGSKDLVHERDGVRAVFDQLSNKGKVFFQVKTFEDFPRSFTEGGRQSDYNEYIRKEADFVIFILDGKIGRITKDEFDIAWDSFVHFKRPKILVYINVMNESQFNDDVEEVRKRVHSIGQYPINYRDYEDLKAQVEHDFVYLE